MTVNNFDKIRDFISFEENTFYFLQIIKRRKENPEMQTGQQVLKSYYINSVEYLDRKREDIIKLCEDNNARAYINLNKRSYEKVAIQMIKYLADAVYNKQHENCKNAFEKIAGRNNADADKKWILDVDTKDQKLITEITAFIQTQRPEGDKVHIILETKAGFHILCSPFDPREMGKRFPEIEIKKDNPTILYIALLP
jgi:hypothetical protein